MDADFLYNSKQNKESWASTINEIRIEVVKRFPKLGPLVSDRLGNLA